MGAGSGPVNCDEYRRLGTPPASQVFLAAL